MRGKGTHRFLTLVALLVLALILVYPVLAQDYVFSVPVLKMEVFIQPDASARIVYEITFLNSRFGDPIDIVDIGMPHSNYDIDNMSASINGVSLSDIRDSEYVHPGVEVHLGSQAIPAEQEGTLHFEFTMPDMVYQDTTRKDYASLQITPTWFDSSLVTGATDVMIVIHMLPGAEPDDVLYQHEPFTQKAIYDDHTVAFWRWESGSATRSNLVGVSFPQQGMDRVIKMSLIELTVKWLNDNPAVRLILGALSAILFIFLFFRFSGGTGFTLFFLLAGVLGCLFAASPIAQLIALPILVVLVIVNEWHLKTRRNKYLPAIAQVEGGGIKRGLTAPESAVLLEMPFGKVLTLVVFGLLSKGILRQVEASPLTVEVAEDFRVLGKPELDNAKSRDKFRRKVAQEKGTILHKYEEPFLYLIEQNAGKPVQKVDFSAAVESLIKQTGAKMKGFDLSDTQDYYRRIVSRAWQKAQSIGEIPEREKFLDNYLPWVMMDEQYPTVLTSGGYNYWPRWVRTPSVVGSGVGGASVGSSTGKPSAGGRTSLGDVSASFAGWAENTMGSLASAVLPSAMNMPSAQGGVLNLSGMDKVTGDIFPALMESSPSGGGGGGGGGGGCACACAGCACACACAGGGR
mgnify:FL=1